MRPNLLRSVSAATLFVGIAALVSPTKLALAQDPRLAPLDAPVVTSGAIVAVFADPSDFVFLLDQVGKCGSGYFHIRRTNTNFKELVAASLTAFALGRAMSVTVTSCQADRNIVNYGAAWR